MIRWIYSAAWYLALPVVVLRLWWRGRHEPGYRQHIAERLGFYSGAPYALRKQPVIWVHAVSVGETRAAEPLVDALLRDYPDHVILLTHMTPTGRATGKALFASYAGRVVQCYLPYDIGSMARRFLQHFSPQVCILMETEVWPNTVAQCVRQGVPVALVNARLSARSLAKGQRLATLMGEAARSLTCVAAQTEADAARLEELGVRNPHVTGSIKFDVEPPANAVSDGGAARLTEHDRVHATLAEQCRQALDLRRLTRLVEALESDKYAARHGLSLPPGSMKGRSWVLNQER